MTDVFQDKFLKLNFTKHAEKRKQERWNKFKNPLPTLIRITKNNLIDQTEKEGKLVKCKVKITYSAQEDLYLMIRPVFKEEKAIVITFWFDKKRKK